MALHSTFLAQSRCTLLVALRRFGLKLRMLENILAILLTVIYLFNKQIMTTEYVGKHSC